MRDTLDRLKGSANSNESYDESIRLLSRHIKIFQEQTKTLVSFSINQMDNDGISINDKITEIEQDFKRHDDLINNLKSFIENEEKDSIEKLIKSLKQRMEDKLSIKINEIEKLLERYNFPAARKRRLLIKEYCETLGFDKELPVMKKLESLASKEDTAFKNLKDKYDKLPIKDFHSDPPKKIFEKLDDNDNIFDELQDIIRKKFELEIKALVSKPKIEEDLLISQLIELTSCLPDNLQKEMIASIGRKTISKCITIQE